MRPQLLLLVLWAVSVSSASSYSTLFGAKRTKARNKDVRRVTDFVATVNHLVEGMWMLADDEPSEGGNMLDEAAKKMIRGIGNRGSKKDAVVSKNKRREGECRTAVALEEHNFHSTRHTEVRNEPQTARRSASVQQSDDADEEVADLSDDQRKAYEKQKEELGEDDRVPRTFCLNGLKVYPGATFQCTSRPGVTVSTIEWMQMTRDEQVQCSITSSRVQCICPRDIDPSNTDNVVACDTPITTHCSVNITEPSAAGCKPYEHNLDWLEPCHWFSTKDTMHLKVNLTCTFDYTEARYPDFEEGVHVVEDYGKDTYSLRTLNETLWSFPQTATGLASGIGLSPGNWLLGNVSGVLGVPHRFTYKLYNFDRAGDNAWRFDKRVEDLEPGELTGEKLLEYSIELSQIPERYFHGGRIYSEAGLLFSPNHTAKLLIDFTDYDPKGQGPDSSSAMAGLIIFIVLTVVFLVLGGVLYYINKTKVRLPDVDKYE